MKVTKAVIPAAGLGTRVLPATKAIPKEMLPIVDKPAIQYIVEEAAAAGITDILIITGRGKTAMEDHFDRSPELEERLLASGKEALYEEMIAISRLANIQYVRQKETKGLGHAVLCAKSFVGNDPFAVLYGDDVILGPVSATKELCDAYEATGKGVLGLIKYPPEVIAGKYGCAECQTDENGVIRVRDMIEKPKLEEVPSPYAVIGRVLLPPSIFEILETTRPGAGNEIQLTDAMRELAHREGMVGVEYSGVRFDMGKKSGIIEAILYAGLRHPEVQDDVKKMIKKLAEIL